MGNFEFDLPMIFGQVIFFAFFTFTFFQPGSQREFQTIEDIKPESKLFKENILIDRGAKNSKVIHFILDLAQHQGQYIRIESKGDFYLFINSAYVLRVRRQGQFNVDSLRNRYSNSIFLSLYQRNGTDDLSMHWGILRPFDELYNPRRPPLVFSNFILVTSVGLVIFFTTLFRTNPQLTLDYLNVSKLFYLGDRDENQITLRVTSSVNLLFYLFCSLLASLALITAVHFSQEGLSFLNYSAITTTGQYLVRWFVLALSILAVLMVKLTFVALVVLLYGWRDITGVHFFNFVRVLILSLSLIAIISLLCFSFGIPVNYFTLLKAGCIMLLIGSGLLFFKLQARAAFRSFHLFSYLCATEIFPLVILIKLILF